ncbi:MAG: DUF2207 domain-containing protein [Clostridia bacterium]|nr:DUF2207 domain-containing protein [Clostridia bacterium]
MKKICFVVLLLIALLSSYNIYAKEADNVSGLDSQVIKIISLSELNTQLISNNNENIISTESGSSVSGDVNATIENETTKNSILNIFITAIEACILVYIISKTFKYINESGKIFSEDIDIKDKYYKELPFEGITPGQALYLKDINRADEGNIFTAALLNMKNKGIINFEYIGNEKLYENVVIKIINEEIPLIGEEKPIYQFLKECVKKYRKDGNYIPLYILQKYMARNKEIIVILKHQIEESTKRSIPSYDGRADLRLKRRTIDIVFYIVLLIVIVLIHLGNFDIFTIHTWIYIISIVNIIHCTGIVTKTNIFGKEGAENRERLKGFERYMKDFTNFKGQGLPEVTIWENYIAFAMDFGIAPSVLKRIKSSYPNIVDSNFMETSEVCEYLLKCNFKRIFLLAK